MEGPFLLLVMVMCVCVECVCVCVCVDGCRYVGVCMLMCVWVVMWRCAC